MSSENREPVNNEGRGDQEPLLGAPGDASQHEEEGLQLNFLMGTGIIAQAGIWILTATVWVSVFLHPVILFSAHPLLNSAGILLIIEAILLLQPTHTPKQKKQGANIHAAINITAVLSLLAALIVIEYNKHPGAHFISVHGILGLVTYILFASQAIVGILQLYAQDLLGGPSKAKALYKYHRMSGYVLVVLAFATVAAATQTDFNKNVLHISLWAVIVTAVITLIGLVPRIKKQKLGF